MGKLIVLEGTDGSGKSTQFQLLITHLKRARIPVMTVKFPQYGQKSSGLIEEYLSGKYGKKPADVNPYAASLFYALDRFDAAIKIQAWLDQGKTVLLDRYVDSNAGHQGGKIKNPGARKKFLHWLYDIEYRILHIPKPNIIIILHAPASVSQSLLAQKKQDIHEQDIQHLRDTEHAYLWLAKTYPKDHCVIECMEKGRLLKPEEIQDKIWAVLQQYLTGEKI